MTPEHACFCELAPLYVLDALSDEERQWIEQQVATCPDLAQELADYQLAITAIPYSGSIVPIAPNRQAQLKAQLFEQLDLTLPTDPPECPPKPKVPSFLGIRSQDLQWEPHFTPGVKIVILHTDPIQRELVGLLRAEAGVHYPFHRHAAVEELYMLSGDLHIGEEVYGPGDYLRSQPGSAHAPHTIGGCMFFFHTSMDDEYPNQQPHVPV